MIHLPATLPAFFSPSFDHRAVPSVISPNFDIEGVEDRAIAVLAISPTAPSRNRTRTNVTLDTDPNIGTEVRESSMPMTDAAITGVFT